MPNESSSGQQAQAEQKGEPDLTSSPHASYRGHASSGDAGLGYLFEDGDAKFQRPRKERTDL